MRLAGRHCHHFTPQQLALISSQAVAKTYRPGDYFSAAGRVAQEIGFIVGGIFRVCYFDRDGTETTKYFLEENHFVVDLQSYQYQLPSAEYVQAVTEAHMLVFKARAWQELAHTIVDWPKMEANLITRALLTKLNRRSPWSVPMPPPAMPNSCAPSPGWPIGFRWPTWPLISGSRRSR